MTAALMASAMAQDAEAVTPKLTIGDPAPAIKVASWVKNAPVEKFEPGKVYVVEFWATWCGPCITTIPHLTETAKKFKDKVTVVGVSVFERQSSPTDTSYLPKVEEFVKEMGEKMDYHVAADVPEGVMAKTWMQAANQNGIPTAFIVDGKGRVVWIGHPMENLDNVLEAVLNGTHDVEAEKARLIKEQEDQEKLAKLWGPLEEAIEKKDIAALDKAMKDVLEVMPDYAPMFAAIKVEVMMESDPEGASKAAQVALEGAAKNDPFALNQMAWYMLEPKDTKADKALALKIAQRAAELTKEEDGMILDTLALGYFRNGKVDEAIKYGELALKNLPEGLPVQMKKELEDRLAEYRKAKG